MVQAALGPESSLLTVALRWRIELIAQPLVTNVQSLSGIELSLSRCHIKSAGQSAVVALRREVQKCLLHLRVLPQIG